MMMPSPLEAQKHPRGTRFSELSSEVAIGYIREYLRERPVPINAAIRQILSAEGVEDLRQRLAAAMDVLLDLARTDTAAMQRVLTLPMAPSQSDSRTGEHYPNDLRSWVQDWFDTYHCQRD
jgi:hypothetical protein